MENTGTFWGWVPPELPWYEWGLTSVALTAVAIIKVNTRNNTKIVSVFFLILNAFFSSNILHIA
jgi:hypothetical protein